MLLLRVIVFCSASIVALSRTDSLHVQAITIASA